MFSSNFMDIFIPQFPIILNELSHHSDAFLILEKTNINLGIRHDPFGKGGKVLILTDNDPEILKYRGEAWRIRVSAAESNSLFSFPF